MPTGSQSNIVVVLKEDQRMTTFQKDGEKDMVKKIKRKTKASSKRRVRGRLLKEEEKEMKKKFSNDWLKPTRQIPVVDR